MKSQMKKKYVDSNLASAFVDRTKITSQSYFLIYLIFIFHLGGNHSNRVPVLIVSVILLINTIFRLYFIYRYKQKKILTRNMLKIALFQSFTNGIFWMVLVSLILFAKSYDVIGIILTSFVSFTLIANSIYILSTYLWLITCYAFFCLLPILIFTLKFNPGGEFGNLHSLAALMLIYFFYVLKQAKKIHIEERMLFSQKFELIRSIKKLEIAQIELKEQTLNSFHTARLSSLGEMTSSIAHEINNPLSVVIGNTQALLKRTANLDESSQDKLNKILFSADRIVKIMKSMKLFSNKSEENVSRVNEIHEILDNTLTLSNDRIKEFNFEFEVIGNQSLKVNCNLIQVTQIVINLINNAIDAMNSFKNEISYNHNGPLKILIEISEDESFVFLRVVNSGPVIPKEIQNKMFQPFYSSKPVGKGTGLGLSISKKLAENNGGNLIYEEYNHKTSFLLTLSKSDTDRLHE